MSKVKVSMTGKVLVGAVLTGIFLLALVFKGRQECVIPAATFLIVPVFIFLLKTEIFFSSSK